MKLNIDCIRDVLLYVEERSKGTNIIVINSNTLSESMNNKYDKETIIYHFIQCSKAKLIDGFRQADAYNTLYCHDLSPLGHEFVANTRNKKIWRKIKQIGCESLPTIISLASQIATTYFSNQI